jgi:uncharacterized membrane protein YdcZ (DUF606 family)
LQPQGAWYVLNVIIFAQHLGAATLTSFTVTAQLASALLLDATGLAGYRKRTVDWQCILGLLLMVAGVVLVSVYRGTEVGGVEAVQPPPAVDVLVSDAPAAPK